MSHSRKAVFVMAMVAILGCNKKDNSASASAAKDSQKVVPVVKPIGPSAKVAEPQLETAPMPREVRPEVAPAPREVPPELAPAPRALTPEQAKLFGALEMAPVAPEALTAGGLIDDAKASASPYDGVFVARCSMVPTSLEKHGSHYERVLYIEKGYYIEFTYFYPNWDCNFKDKGVEMFRSQPGKIQVVDDSINRGYKRINITFPDGTVLKDIIRLENDVLSFSRPYEQTLDFQGYPMAGSTDYKRKQ